MAGAVDSLGAGEVKNPLSDDNLLTAARRVVRYVRGDDSAHGGLLSKQTVEATEWLARHVEREEKRVKAMLENGDA